MEKVEIRALQSDLQSFSLIRYPELLTRLIESGNFICPTRTEFREKSYFLRHDVDFSIRNAIKMARIENKLGIHAHYYFLADSQSYNVTSMHFRNAVDEIKSLGHCLGLHFDRQNESISVEEEFLTQIKRLSVAAKIEIRAYSPHNPGPLVMKYTRDIPQEYINAYSYVNEGKMGYISDSNGKWQSDYLDEFLQKTRKNDYQILIHPEWWTEQEMEPLSKIIFALGEEFLGNLTDYLESTISAPRYSVQQRINMRNQIDSIASSIKVILGK
jgi:hypothetical protein